MLFSYQTNRENKNVKYNIIENCIVCLRLICDQGFSRKLFYHWKTYFNRFTIPYYFMVLCHFFKTYMYSVPARSFLQGELLALFQVTPCAFFMTPCPFSKSICHFYEHVSFILMFRNDPPFFSITLPCKHYARIIINILPVYLDS